MFMDFFGGIYGVLFVYDIHEEQRGGRTRDTEFWPIFIMAVHGFWGRGFSFRDV